MRRRASGGAPNEAPSGQRGIAVKTAPSGSATIRAQEAWGSDLASATSGASASASSAGAWNPADKAHAARHSRKAFQSRLVTAARWVRLHPRRTSTITDLRQLDMTRERWQIRPPTSR